MIDKAVKTILLNYAGLTALVGDRIYPLIRTQGSEPPALTYQKISDSKKAAGTGIRTARFQISCIAATALQASTIAVQVKAAFDGKHETISGVDVFNSFDEDASDFYDDETKLYRMPVDVMVDYK